jgi:hypothetical protein
LEERQDKGWTRKRPRIRKNFLNEISAELAKVIFTSKCLFWGYTFKINCETHSTCAECMWQHKGAGGFITFLRPFSFRKQTLSKQKLPAAKELETE